MMTLNSFPRWLIICLDCARRISSGMVWVPEYVVAYYASILRMY